MKIKVFFVLDESFSYGDLNNSSKKFFATSELRDDYFEFLRKDYSENQGLSEYMQNHFQPEFSSRWSYYIEKGEEELEIIEEKTW